jgi:1-phosphofructokinase family hexose kinase
VVGPNLTVDRTLRLPRLVPGAVLRAQEVVATPGGKGVNVVRAATALRVPATLLGFTAGHTGRALAGLLRDDGVALLAVPCAGEARSTLIALEEDGRATVVNEPGPTLGEADWRALEAATAEALAAHAMLVCSGSVPPGAPPDAYARLTLAARRAGVGALVDASGPLLREALAAEPDIVCPNLAEAEAVLGREAGGEEDVEAAPDAPERARAAAAALRERGARAAVVTAAGAGAAFAGADGREGFCRAPAVSVRNPIGAGDAFAAGLAAALAAGAELGAAVAAATAVGAASVEAPRAGDLDAARARALEADLRA